MKRKGEWFEWSISNDWTEIPLQEIFKSKLHAPKSLVHEWRMNKQVKVNGEDPNWVKPLQKNDRLSIQLFEEEDYGVIPSYKEIDILYEDDHLIIVNKPAWMNTHPNNEGETDTLANALAFYYQMNGLHIKTRHIHRLDQNTSGAIIFAKHRLAHAILDNELQKRNIKRTYEAVVHGRFKSKKGTIDAPIGRDKYHSIKRRVSKTGQKAITHYEVLHYSKEQNCSIVRLSLDTGRTHQIRVHLSSIGHPIIGDTLYGGQTEHIKRQALHAKHVNLQHPITKQPIEVTAPFPKDIQRVVNLIKK